MNSVQRRPAALRARRVGRNLVIAVGAAVAILTISQTGSANSSYALWNSTATVDAGSITTGSILADIDIAGLSGAYTSGQLAQSGAVSISNNGTVSADYTTNFAWSAVSAAAMTGAISTLVWKAASPADCSSAAPGGATVLSGAGPTGTLAAGATDVYCLSTTLNPSGVPSGSAASATFDVNLQLSGWTSAATDSIAQTFSDTAAPSVPTLSCSDLTSTSVTMLWTASADDVGVVGYDLYRGTQKVASLSASDTKFVDASLSGATSYEYTVKARDAAGNVSDASDPRVVTTLPTPDTRAPSAPGNLVGNTTTTAATISWTVSTDNVGVTGYDVYRDGTYVKTVTTLTFTDTNLNANTSYSYTVKAHDAAGNASAASTALAVTTQLPPDTLKPTEPTALVATNTTTTATTISWTGSTDNVGVIGYVIYRDNVKLATVSALTYTDNALVAGTSYSYTITAIDAAANESVASTALSVATPAPVDTLAPTVPTGLVATTTTSSATTISWTASSDNVAVADYLVYRDGTLVGTVTTPSFTDSGLTGDSVYTYTVKARDAAGNASAASTPLAVRTGVATLGCFVDKKTKPLITIPGTEPGPWSLLVNGVFYENVTLRTFEYKKIDSAIGNYVVTVKRADGSLAGTVTLAITSSSSGFTCG
jgi:chitodextrinase